MVIDALSGEGMPIGVEKIVRIRGFSRSELLDLASQLEDYLISGSRHVLELSSDGDLHSSRVVLCFSLTDVDQGIRELRTPSTFSCGLTKQSMQDLVDGMREVANNPRSYVWGYNLSESVTRIELLISQRGNW